MLTSNDLMTLDTLPKIYDVSLSLYKDHFLSNLLPLTFYYDFTDGTKEIVKFQKLRFRHILGIHHIDKTTTDYNIFTMIDNGLSFVHWKRNPKQKRKFVDMTDRILLFSCVFNTLRFGRVFFCPGQIVKNSPNVKLDYIVHRQISNRGLNLGLRFENNVQSPITILPSRPSDYLKYVDQSNAKIVKHLKIVEDASNTVRYDIVYTDDFIMMNTI